MALGDRGALGFLIVAVLALAVRLAADSLTPGRTSWNVYWGVGGVPLWTTDKNVAEGVRLDAGLDGGRVGGRMGLLLGTRLNPSTADFGDWVTLPGVGEKTAREILAARERLGGFTTLSDLLEARGIGPKKLEKLSPWLEAR